MCRLRLQIKLAMSTAYCVLLLLITEGQAVAGKQDLGWTAAQSRSLVVRVTAMNSPSRTAVGRSM